MQWAVILLRREGIQEVTRIQKSEHFCSSHSGCFHRAGANYCSKPVISARDGSISLNAAGWSRIFHLPDFAGEENPCLVRGRGVRKGRRAPEGDPLWWRWVWTLCRWWADRSRNSKWPLRPTGKAEGHGKRRKSLIKTTWGSPPSQSQ